MAVAMEARTASGRAGMAPAWEATQAPQRLPASLSVGEACAAEQVVREGGGVGVAGADGVCDLDGDAGVLVPFVAA